jgi:hypothetical protein
MKNMLARILRIMGYIVLAVPLGIFIGLYSKRKSKEEIMEYASEVISKYSDDIKSFIDIDSIAKTINSDFEGNKHEMGRFSYKYESNYFRRLRNLVYTNNLLLDGDTEYDNYIVFISINTESIYRRVFQIHALFRLRLLSTFVHEHVHYKQLQNGEISRTIDTIDAVSDYIGYSKQKIEIDARRTARRFILKKFFKIIFYK